MMNLASPPVDMILLLSDEQLIRSAEENENNDELED